MTEPKLTPLFPPSITPVREGVYRVEFGDEFGDWCKWFALWRAHHWHYTAPTPDYAKSQYLRSQDCYNPSFLGWRGLAEKPGEAE